MLLEKKAPVLSAKHTGTEGNRLKLRSIDPGFQTETLPSIPSSALGDQGAGPITNRRFF
jgi:hypothetical protein